MIKVLLIGCDGQVGSEIKKILPDDFELYTTSYTSNETNARHFNLDLTNEIGIRDLIQRTKPNCLINAAAYTAVDQAEVERDLAMQVNARAVQVMAEELKRLGSWLIHFSTDYVFDGTGSHFRSEEESTNPLNYYGVTKLKGEELIRSSGVHHTIFRTSWVFSSHGHNFVKTMLRLGKERKAIKIVCDQIGAPTSARLIAELSCRALSRQMTDTSFPVASLYHLCCSGVTSWHEFGEEIFLQARQLDFPLLLESVYPIPSTKFPTPARRPANSRLNCERIEASFELKLPDWRDELKIVMQELKLT